ncbi:MAG: thiamine pyrophosphate-dependent dehydrogenase E1 component subunit alpha [Candidatus Omnitrophota bacterium]
MENDVQINLKYFSKMLLIRYFEEKIDWLFSRDMLAGTAHLCIGQEAVAVGAVSAINSDDFVISTHRGHGHLLAKGADPKLLFCEIMGKETGYCKGRGGTQHLCVRDINFLGTNGITGGGMPIATGVGMALKLQKRQQVVLCFFGDGAANQGTFHESLNMASIWKVPVVYICENNLYAMSVSVKESMNITDIAVRAGSYGIPGEIVDGMDVVKVKSLVAAAVQRAREGEGPTLIEAKTYRFCGHSKSDAQTYRSKEEKELWKMRDPLTTLENNLISSGLNAQTLNSLKEKAKSAIEESYNFAVSDTLRNNEKI